MKEMKSLLFTHKLIQFRFGFNNRPVVRCSFMLEHPLMYDGLSDQSPMVDQLNYFSFQPVHYDCCNKGCGMYSPVCEMVHIKEPLLLGKSSPPFSDSSGFPKLYLSGHLLYVQCHITVNKMC